MDFREKPSILTLKDKLEGYEIIMFNHGINFGQDRFQKLKTRQKILLGFSAPLILMVVIATVVYFSIGKLLDTSQWVQHTQRVIAGGQELTKLMIDMETGERGFLITGKDHFLEPFNNSQQVWNDKILELKTLVEDNPIQIEQLDKIDALEKDWLTYAAAPEIEMRRKVGKATVDAYHLQEILSRGEGKRIIDDFMALGHEVETFFSERGDWEGAFATEIIEKSLADREDSQRGFLITGKEEFLGKYTAGEQVKLPAYFARLRAIVSDRGFENELMGKIDQLGQLATEWTHKAAEPEIAARRQMNKHPETLADVKALLEKETGKKIVDAIRGQLSEFINVEKTLMTSRVQQAEIAASNSIILIIAGTLFSVLIALFVAFIVSGTIVKRLEILLGATRKVADGDFTETINVKDEDEDEDEIGRLARAFNRMTSTLRASREKMAAANDDLIIEKEKAEESEIKFRNLVEGSLQGIFVHRDFKPLFANQICADMFGYSNPEEILDLDSLLETFWVAAEQEQIRDYKTYRMAGDETANIYECQGIRKDGSLFWIENHVTLIDWQGQKAIQVAVIDITERKRVSEELSHQANHDTLTGLANRREFERRAERLLSTVRQDQSEHALCFMDLDQFKVVNDTCGHTAGDELLRQLSSLLKRTVRHSDTLARLGGDEFSVLMEHCSLDDAHRVATSLQKAIQGYQFSWEGHSFTVGVSMGLVPITETTANLTELLKNADAACYMAKDKGRNRIHVYHAEDVEMAQRHGEMQWVTRLNQALAEDRFCLYAQTILPLDGSTDKHYELLLRMTDEEGEIIPPGAFLPAAERYNLMSKIDRWVIEHAFDLLADNPAFLSQINFISINLSA